jgi:hypothetical protein
MIVLLGVGLALITLLIAPHGQRGLLRLSQIRFAGGWYVASAAALQLASIATHTYHLVVVAITLLLVARFCWLNRERPGILLIALGVALNSLAMSANGGTMPVDPQALQQIAPHRDPSTVAFQWSKGEVAAASHPLLWLGDRWFLPGPLAPLALWSIGDACLLAGVGVLLWTAMRQEIGDDRSPA